MSEPIKVQLRALLFRKALRRKDVALESGGSAQVLNLSVLDLVCDMRLRSSRLSVRFTFDASRLASFANDTAGLVVAVVDRKL